MKQLVCIVCPNGCALSIDEKTCAVTGNQCRRGAAFALSELTHPMRTLTTTVRTAFPSAPVLPVRTDGEIDKAAIPAVIAALAKVCVNTRLCMGETVLDNAAGTGCKIIATSDILEDAFDV